MVLKKKRIAIFTERIYPFYSGGSEKVMYDYAQILSEKYDVTVFTSFDQGKAKQSLINVDFVYISKKIKKSNKNGNHSLKGILSFSIFSLLGSKEIKNFDVVILDSIHYFYPLLLLKLFRLRNKKIVSIFHEAWYEYRMSNVMLPPLSFLMGIFIRRLIRYSDKIVSISNSTSESLLRNYNVKKDLLITIPLGIDYDNIANRYPVKNLEDRRYDLVFVGRFAAIKKIENIVDAVSLLNERGKNLQIALIGDGPQKKSIQQKIETIGLDKNFHLFGFLNENDKFSIVADSKFFILPSEREGFSLSTLEAMTFGCIPIVSKPKFDEVFGVSHFVKDGKNGIYYTCGNVLELAQTIFNCLENLERYKPMSISAIETSKFFTRDEMKKKILNTLNQMIS